MIDRYIIIVVVWALMASSTSADDCIKVEDDISIVTSLLEDGKTKQAVKFAQKLVRVARKCVDTHQALITAMNARQDEVSGLSALIASRKFRTALKNALKVAPDSVQFRVSEIEYLIHAPGIAGGDRKKAKIRIDELEEISALSASRMGLELGRIENDTNLIMDSLKALVKLDPFTALIRSEYARRLILSDQLDSARRELNAWTTSMVAERDQGWFELERLYLEAAVRVYGNDAFQEAEAFLKSYIEKRPFIDHSRLASMAQAYALLGSIYQGLDQTVEAEAAYKMALAENPQNKRAKAGIESLKN